MKSIFFNLQKACKSKIINNFHVLVSQVRSFRIPSFYKRKLRQGTRIGLKTLNTEELRGKCYLFS